MPDPTGRIVPNPNHPDPGIGTEDMPWADSRLSVVGTDRIETVDRKEAAATISGHRFVVIDSDDKIYLADAENPAHAHSVFGMTKGAIAAGDKGQIIISGKITEPGWSFSDFGKPLYLRSNGEFSIVSPTVGFVLMVGFILSEKTVFVKVGLPTFLSD